MLLKRRWKLLRYAGVEWMVRLAASQAAMPPASSQTVSKPPRCKRLAAMEER